MTNDDKIRTQLLDAMTRKGLRQAELARQIGVTPQSLNQVIKGSRAALPRSLTAVLDKLGLELTVAEKGGEEVPPTGTVRSVPETPDSELSPEDNAWLEAFLEAAKGQSTGEPPYREGSVVLVQFGAQQDRPCVTLTLEKIARASKSCGIVPLAAEPWAGRITGFEETVGGLPASSVVLCNQVQTVDLAQIKGCVGRLSDRKLKLVRNSVTKFLALERAADGRYNSWQRD